MEQDKKLIKQLKEQLKNKDFCIDIIVPDTIKVPKRKRQKVKPPKQLVTYLDLDNKKISFLEARKILVDHIKTNNYFGEDKSLIDLPKDFRKLLDLDDGFIRRDDIDKIVELCYKN